MSDSNGKLSARDLTLAAKATVEDLTGQEAETVSALQSDGENWLVTVEVCELERVPNTTDVMASYVVQLDDAGGLLGYNRERRLPARRGRTAMSSAPIRAGGGLPGRPESTTNLADILERVLDKGIVIAGDIQINLLDIELLTIKLRLLVASVDKAREMGINWWEGDPACRR
jgi:hypothetical protein